MRPPPTYNRYPTVPISSAAAKCIVGWERVLDQIGRGKPGVLCVECYPGVCVEEFEPAIVQALRPTTVIRSSDCLKSPAEVRTLLSPYLTHDPVFGRMNGIRVEDFFDPLPIMPGASIASRRRTAFPDSSGNSPLLRKELHGT